eukprot:COSAG03_NODE_4323_length_1592_cov_2.098459_4_plen_53_part_01
MGSGCAGVQIGPCNERSQGCLFIRYTLVVPASHISAKTASRSPSVAATASAVL